MYLHDLQNIDQNLRKKEREKRRRRVKKAHEDAIEAGEFVGTLDEALKLDESKPAALDAFMKHVFAEAEKLAESKITLKEEMEKSKEAEKHRLEEEISLLEQENAVLREKNVEWIRNESMARAKAEEKCFKEATTKNVLAPRANGNWRTSIKEVQEILSKSQVLQRKDMLVAGEKGRKMN